MKMKIRYFSTSLYRAENKTIQWCLTDSCPTDIVGTYTVCLTKSVSDRCLYRGDKSICI